MNNTSKINIKRSVRLKLINSVIKHSMLINAGKRQEPNKEKEYQISNGIINQFCRSFMTNSKIATIEKELENIGKNLDEKLSVIANKYKPDDVEQFNQNVSGRLELSKIINQGNNFEIKNIKRLLLYVALGKIPSNLIKYDHEAYLKDYTYYLIHPAISALRNAAENALLNLGEIHKFTELDYLSTHSGTLHDSFINMMHEIMSAVKDYKNIPDEEFDTTLTFIESKFQNILKSADNVINQIVSQFVDKTYQNIVEAATKFNNEKSLQEYNDYYSEDNEESAFDD